MPILSQEQWQDFCRQYPDHSFLQDAAWGEVKSRFGWTPVYVSNGNAGAMVLFRQPKAGFSAAYIPRGPLGTDFAALWPEIHALCRERQAVFLRVEPDFWQGTSEADALLASMKEFRPSYATVQPPRTIVLDLNGTEDEWLARMNQKTRYNIRLSQKKGLTVTETEDCAVFHDLMTTTGSRDNFGVHSEAYYRCVLESFKENKRARILLVSYQGKPLSAMMLIAQGKRGTYLYGASSNEERNRMPNHLIQWTAMKICRDCGCTEYDLWGVPDEEESVLEAQFQDRHDGLWPVYRFKRGFGGRVLRTAGSWDCACLPLPYYAIRALSTFRRKKAA